MPTEVQQTEHFTRVHLRGQLDVAQLEALGRELTATLGETPASPRVVFDLLEFGGCDANTRRALVELQAMIGDSNGRTVWLSNRPDARGLALWACHFAKDGHAKVVATEAQIRPWLDSEAKRLDKAMGDVSKTLQEIRRRMKRLGPGQGEREEQ